MDKLLHHYKQWKYRNTFILFLSLIFLLLFVNTDFGQNTLTQISQYGYIGALISGIFFVFTFTIAPASVVLYHIAESHNIYLVAIIGGLGAAFGDYIIFRFLKDSVFEELRPIFKLFGGSYIIKVLHSRYFIWLTPIIGALIIASPFPDEVGVGLMGLSKIKTWQFISLAFILDTIGIFLIIYFASIV